MRPAVAAPVAGTPHSTQPATIHTCWTRVFQAPPEESPASHPCRLRGDSALSQPAERPRNGGERRPRPGGPSAQDGPREPGVRKGGLGTRADSHSPAAGRPPNLARHSHSDAILPEAQRKGIGRKRKRGTRGGTSCQARPHFSPSWRPSWGRRLRWRSCSGWWRPRSSGRALPPRSTPSWRPAGRSVWTSPAPSSTPGRRPAWPTVSTASSTPPCPSPTALRSSCRKAATNPGSGGLWRGPLPRSA